MFDIINLPCCKTDCKMNYIKIPISGSMVFGLGKKKKKAPAPPRPMIRDF